MAVPRFQMHSVRRRSGAPSPLSFGPTLDARPTGHDDMVVWRLLGTNNREIGRGADQFATEQHCLDAIALLQQLVEHPLHPKVAFSSSFGPGFAWYWTLEVGRNVVATASRTFSRQRECRSNFDHFVASAQDAQVIATVRQARKDLASRNDARLPAPRVRLIQPKGAT